MALTSTERTRRWRERHGSDGRLRELEQDRLYYSTPRAKELLRKRDATRREKRQHVNHEKYLSTKRFITAVKLTTGCIDCGYDNCASALHFDHVRGRKERAVSTFGPRSISWAVAEIEKCEVRCANCHAERHERER